MFGRLLLCGGCFAAAVAVLLPFYRPSPPKIGLSQSVIEFGEADPGVVLFGELGLKNEGGGKLVVSEIRTSCGCTVATISQSVIESKGEARIRVKFTPGSDRVSSASIQIQTNDQNTPSITIPVRSHRREKVLVSPERFVITDPEGSHPEVIAGVVHWTDEKIRDFSETQFQIEDAIDGLEFEIREAEGVGRAEIVCRIVDDLPAGVGLFQIRLFDTSFRINRRIDVEVRNMSNRLAGPERILLLPREEEKRVRFRFGADGCVSGKVVAEFNPAATMLRLKQVPMSKVWS